MLRKKKGSVLRLIVVFMVAMLMIINIPVQAKSLSNMPSDTRNIEILDNRDNQTLDTGDELGENQSEYVSNNKPYEWYIDQGNTGKYSNNNCGPSSVTMALKWIDENFNMSAEDARNTYLNDGDWWSTDDITNYLDLYGGKYTIESVSDSLLKSELRKGNIAILCIDSSLISYNSNKEQRVGRFYEYGGGHFIVVKGFQVDDGKTYFEVYDPNTWNESYSDGQPKGKDRYYLSEELIKASQNWWNNSIIIQP